MTPNLIRQAAVMLSNILEFNSPADAKLSEFFRNNRDLGTKERAFVAESVYGVLRRLRFLSTVTANDAVSYTHLDVYKRQECSNPPINRTAPMESTPNWPANQ